MGTRPAAIGASMLLVFNVVMTSRAQGANARPALPSGRSSGLRTDGLSEKQLKTWRKIREIVMAEGPDGQPLHPTLRRLWEAVESSPHTVFVEMPDTRSYFAGRFEVTRVDPTGRAHEGLIILNLRAIDHTSTGPAAPRADGFVPLKGLHKDERYAEVLGHELAHAVWHLASTERARLAERLQGQLEGQAQVLLAGGATTVSGTHPESDLDRLARELEGPAETAEHAIWAELRASR